jgi:bifunctional non-homologous end joining protein LigD
MAKAKTKAKPKPKRAAKGAAKKKGKRKLSEYERKRSFDATPEPSGRGEAAGGGGNRFVVQEHHARSLHWDFRLEKDGVLVSWALPKGVPEDPKENRLAVHTEDHPLDYIDFEGEIPAGQYGAGEVTIWDHGTYEAEKFRDDKVIVTLNGERVSGKYALFQTKDRNWMIHRMDPPATDREPMPEHLRPMMATLSTLPHDEDEWAYEIKWDGVRAIAYCDSGHIRLESRNLKVITPRYPELRKLAEELGARRVVLDGEVVAFDEDGRPDFQRLQARMHLASDSAVRRRMADIPVTYVIFDVLHIDGETLLDLPYSERRERLEELDLDGPSWQTPRNHFGDGAKLLEATRERNLEGIVAKRLTSRYLPGKRSRYWLKVKNVFRQELVIGGWLPGRGRRDGMIGALLVGYHDAEGNLRYAGRVGTGYTEDDLKRLAKRLEPLRRGTSPFEGRQPPKESNFVEPRLVCEVEFREWTSARTLRAPSFKGLRDDKDPADVHVEEPESPPKAGEEPK